MPWTKTPNVAMYGLADWSGYQKTVSNCTPQQAQRIAMLDPTTRFFFFARETMVLTNPSWPEPKVFQPGDAVFFSGEPWWGSAPQCDSYQKNGLSLAYIGSLSASDPTSPLIAGDYVTAQGLNAVDIVSLFAANLNLTTSGDYIRLAPNVKVPSGGTLAVAHDYYVQVFQQSVAALQAQGITVLLTFLNNHDNSGWSEFDPNTTAGQESAQSFANQLQYVVDTYGFDGIDIDDEYSTGTPYDGSLAMVTSMMRQLMPNSIISKALWNDSQDFGPTYGGVSLAQTLTYGWQMSYGAMPQQMLPPYVGYGMSQASLSMGYQTGYSVPDPSSQVAWLKTNGYAGFMVYAFENSANQAYLGKLVNDWMGPGNWNKTSANLSS